MVRDRVVTVTAGSTTFAGSALAGGSDAARSGLLLALAWRVTYVLSGGFGVMSEMGVSAQWWCRRR